MTHPAIGTISRVEALQETWPDHVRLSLMGAPPASSPDQPNIYGYHPYLFVGAFPGLDDRGLEQLSVAAYLFANVLFAVDRAADQDWLDEARGPMDMLAGQFEAYRALARLFPGDSLFWDVLRARMVDYMTVVRDQRLFSLRERPLTEFSYAMTVDWARSKAALATVTVAALGELARARRPVEALTRSLEHYSVAMQVLDDVLDWRADLSAYRPSLPLARALAKAEVDSRDREALTTEEIERVGRALYADGVIADMVALMKDQLDQARAAADGFGVDEWLAHLDTAQTTVEALRERLPDVNAPTPVRAAATAGARRPAVSVRIRVDHSRPWQSLGFRSLRWLLGQWRLGFPDANHVMSFPGQTGPRPHIGDVFSRALIANVLVEADRALANGQLAPCVAAEIDHLLSRRRPEEPGLWAYFPDLPDLPCDADDLAEMVRLLTRTGRADVLATRLATALSVAFDDGGRPDGSFGTWLIPKADPANWAVRQSKAAQELWGEENADPEVVANLLHAVAEYAHRPYRHNLDQGTKYLLGVQSQEGCWPSGWYEGRLYATYVSMRAIAALRPDALDALERAQDYLLGAQRSDGGWANTGEASDPLGTAFALLGLAQATERGLTRPAERENAATNACHWLTEAMGTDGAFAEEPFILMSPGRSPGLDRPLRFGSRSITTAMVCQAAITWDSSS